MRREYFIGYPVDSLSMEEALSWIADSLSSNKSKTIAVINANKMWQAHRNVGLSHFLKNADLIIPEYAVVWGAKKLGISLNHVAGIMLLKAFIPFAEEKRIRPYFLGARADIVQKMVEKIKEDHPRLPIAGYHHGYLTDEKVKKEVIHDLKKKKPDILFMGMGSPKQEYLIDELKAELTIAVFIGVGGSFDVVSGNKRDAPSWARSKGLEWLYRIWQEPQKIEYWKRYSITNLWFVWKVLCAKRTKRCRKIYRN